MYKSLRDIRDKSKSLIICQTICALMLVVGLAQVPISISKAEDWANAQEMCRSSHKERYSVAPDVESLQAEFLFLKYYFDVHFPSEANDDSPSTAQYERAIENLRHKWGSLAEAQRRLEQQIKSNEQNKTILNELIGDLEIKKKLSEMDSETLRPLLESRIRESNINGLSEILRKTFFSKGHAPLKVALSNANSNWISKNTLWQKRKSTNDKCDLPSYSDSRDLDITSTEKPSSNPDCQALREAYAQLLEAQTKSNVFKMAMSNGDFSKVADIDLTSSLESFVNTAMPAQQKIDIEEALVEKTVDEIKTLEAKISTNAKALKTYEVLTQIMPMDLAYLESRINSMSSAIFDRDTTIGEPLCDMSFAQHLAIKWYSRIGYRVVNGYLRTPTEKKTVRPEIDAWVNVMNSGFNKLQPYSGQVRRGTNLPEFVRNSYLVGKSISDFAFTSTSRKSGFGGQVHQLTYTLTGHSCFWIAPIAREEQEDEVLCRNSTVFRVEKANGTRFELLEERP